MTLEWKNPPPKAGRTTDWDAIANELRDHPGTWALVSTRPKSAGQVASALRNGHYAGFVKGEFEAKSRGTEVYARYIGTPKLRAAGRAS